MPPRKHIIAQRLGILAIAAAICLILIILFALTWPYDKFSYGEPGKLKTDEFTSEGIPVVRQGERIVWDQPFCNRGVDTLSNRWADIYGQANDAGFATIAPANKEERVASFEVPAIIFYGYQDLCGTTEVFAILPNYITPGAYYRFRIQTSYEANPLREITSTTTTELFLLLEQGQAIPEGR
jgi:hypothetical protein